MGGGGSGEPDSASAQRQGYACGCQKKTEAKALLNEVERIIWECAEGSAEPIHADRLHRHIIGQLTCLGRHTITGALCSNGRQFDDWSADYRFYSEERFCEQSIFAHIQDEVVSLLPEDEALVVAMDDSLIRKRGRKIHGAKYQRDPLSPPFHTNLVLGQRFVQISAAVPGAAGDAQMVPIDFLHAPMPQKPGKRASWQEWAEYERARERTNINLYGTERLGALRRSTDKNRHIVVNIDGRFTNSTTISRLPENTTIIGRVRSDAYLHIPCFERTGKPGRPKSYYQKAPTPQEPLKDDSIPWTEVQAFAVGQMRTFKIKTISSLRWKATGRSLPLRLLVIKPVGYRLRKKSKILQRQPAFLICSDPDMPVQRVLQLYLWRWGIEVNFRDEKTLLGLGQAQVRTEASCQKAPALAVAAYAILLVAALKAFGSSYSPITLPNPKWRQHKPKSTPSTAQLLNQLRVDLWASATDLHIFRDFSATNSPHHKPLKLISPLKSAAFYAIQ